MAALERLHRARRCEPRTSTTKNSGPLQKGFSLSSFFFLNSLYIRWAHTHSHHPSPVDTHTPTPSTRLAVFGRSRTPLSSKHPLAAVPRLLNRVLIHSLTPQHRWR